MGQDGHRPALWRHGASAAPLVGVGGWLALFIFFYGVAIPLFSGVAEFGLFMIASRFPEGIGTPIFYAIEIGVNGALALTAGLALWRMRPIGVALAKAAILYGVLSNWLLYVHGLSDGFALAIGDDRAALPWAIIRTLVGAAWFTYFVRSRRVQATYSSPDPTPAT